jgi:hypothetical protein
MAVEDAIAELDLDIEKAPHCRRVAGVEAGVAIVPVDREDGVIGAVDDAIECVATWG